MKRIAYYGGSFDPVHNGHLAVAHALLKQFELDKFVFLPAFHAPHKRRKRPTSAYDRYAMLCLLTENQPNISVSKMEIETPEQPYTVETLPRLIAESPDAEIFFVMGADSWMDITTWREWEKVLTLTSHIVVTRPGYPVTTEHVTDAIRAKIGFVFTTPPGCSDTKADTRSVGSDSSDNPRFTTDKEPRIYLTDTVNVNISATSIRQKFRENNPTWRNDVPDEVANYIEKYQIYN